MLLKVWWRLNILVAMVDFGGHLTLGRLAMMLLMYVSSYGVFLVELQESWWKWKNGVWFIS
jgi:hypothetical protein